MKNIMYLFMAVLILTGIVGVLYLTKEKNNHPPKISEPLQSCLVNPVKNANISVDYPIDNASIVGGKFIMTGKATNIFENQFNYKLETCSGEILSQGQIIAVGNQDGSADFSKEITYATKNNRIPAVLELFDYSEKDGSVQELTQIPLLLSK